VKIKVLHENIYTEALFQTVPSGTKYGRFDEWNRDFSFVGNSVSTNRFVEL
jgi:hypothetical protein